MATAGWKKPEIGDAEALVEFLAREEYRCVSLSERLARGFSLGGARDRPGFAASFREPFKAPVGFWLHHDEVSIDGAALLCPKGSAWCLLPRNGRGIADLAAVFDPGGRLSSLSGPGEDVGPLSATIGRVPRIARRYALMRSCGEIAPLAAPEGVGIRRASMRDIPSLCSLHGAYEKEEMPEAPRSCLPSLLERMVGMLRRQVVVIASLDGLPVGKANTNARGLSTDQLGGIYVRPEARNRGIGAFMTGSLAAMLRHENRSVCLYVRPENGEAERMYGKLGFDEAGSYAAFHF